MAFRIESISKVVSLANEFKAKYESIPAKDIKLCLSTGNKKIGRVMNVSLMPILTCGHCSHCMGVCYDIKACLQYPNTVIDARMRNTVLMMRDRNRYFALIEGRIARRRKNKYFRWHVAGDIVDLDYFSRMVDIAKNHPDFTFWTYTKMYEVVNQYVAEHGGDRHVAIPANLSVMFSKWDGLDMPNPYGFPVFECRLAKDKNMVMTTWHCPGNCDVCKATHRGCVAGESSWIDEH